MSLSCTVTEISRNIGQKSSILTYTPPVLPYLYLAPSLGWVHSSFAKIFGVKKLESLTALSYGFVGLCLAVLIQYRLPTDGWTDRRIHRKTQDHRIYRVSTASRGKKPNLRYLDSYRPMSSSHPIDLPTSWQQLHCVYSVGIFRLSDFSLYFTVIDNNITQRFIQLDCFGNEQFNQHCYRCQR